MKLHCTLVSSYLCIKLHFFKKSNFNCVLILHRFTTKLRFMLISQRIILLFNFMLISHRFTFKLHFNWFISISDWFRIVLHFNCVDFPTLQANFACGDISIVFQADFAKINYNWIGGDFPHNYFLITLQADFTRIYTQAFFKLILHKISC